jgi:hypothetical protein
MMHRQKSFPLRLAEAERERAHSIAAQTGVSENRLYAEIIHEGLLMREQLAYYERLREMAVPAEVGLTVLAKVKDVTPVVGDEISASKAG